MRVRRTDRNGLGGVLWLGGSGPILPAWPAGLNMGGVTSVLVALAILAGATGRVGVSFAADAHEAPDAHTTPDWVADAIFYQIFPERFRNGDTSNDPTRETLEFPEQVSDQWKITPWGADWYARADWEKNRGPNFYDDGVFDRRFGGDLQGVIDKLDYLAELGINTIYFNPVFYARSMHKYDGNTYHHVDPNFGPDPEGDLLRMQAETSDPDTWGMTAADKLFFELVEKAHEHGLRVIIDGVFNHTGRDFFAFTNLKEKQAESPYKDWYIVTQFDDPNTGTDEFVYKGWWGVMTLPEFADNEAGDDLHPGPKQYIFDATKKWMDPNGDGDPSDGIDGWRLDVAAEVPTGFWADWNEHVRSINPEAYTVAEHWEDAAHFLAEGGFSATMNYYGFAWPVKGYLIDGTLSPTDAASMLTERMNKYPERTRYSLQNLIDSHDTDRVASMIVNAATDRPYVSPERFDYDMDSRVSPRHWGGYSVRKPDYEERRIQRMVALMQATFVGAPMFYYGTEAGMWGADDPCDRMAMIWPDIRYDRQTTDPLGRDHQASDVSFDHELHLFYKALMGVRTRHSALRRGDIEFVVMDDDAKGLAFKRSDNTETIWAIFNRGAKTWTFELPGASTEMVAEVFTSSGEPHRVVLNRSNGTLKVTLPALESVILRQPGQALAVTR